MAKKNYQHITNDLSQYIEELRKIVPETMQAFHALATGASASGELDKKTEELIALAICVPQRCDGCFGFHAKTLNKLGSTREEIAKVMAMCIDMGDGPEVMCTADAIRAFDQFQAA